MEIGKLIGMSVKNNLPNMLINFNPEKKDASNRELFIHYHYPIVVKYVYIGEKSNG